MQKGRKRRLRVVGRDVKDQRTGESWHEFSPTKGLIESAVSPKEIGHIPPEKIS